MRARALLGFAQRAGRVASGHAAVLRAIGRRKAKLVIVACDASPRTRRGVEEAAKSGGIPVAFWESMADLGMALGKPDRAVAAVCDDGFARALIAALQAGEGEKGRGDEDE